MRKKVSLKALKGVIIVREVVGATEKETKGGFITPNESPIAQGVAISIGQDKDNTVDVAVGETVYYMKDRAILIEHEGEKYMCVHVQALLYKDVK